MKRARVVTLNAALGPLDYRVPEGIHVEPGSIVVAPLAAPLRRLCEWTADYYYAPLASVLRMVLPSSAALDGSRQLTEYRPTGLVPNRLTPQREKALAALEGR